MGRMCPACGKTIGFEYSTCPVCGTDLLSPHRGVFPHDITVFGITSEIVFDFISKTISCHGPLIEDHTLQLEDFSGNRIEYFENKKQDYSSGNISIKSLVLFVETKKGDFHFVLLNKGSPSIEELKRTCSLLNAFLRAMELKLNNLNKKREDGGEAVDAFKKQLSERREPERKNFFYMRLAGVTYNQRQSAISQLRAGQTLIAVREKDNRFDDNAVLITTEDGIEVGYLPRERNHPFAHAMDAGQKLSVCVKNVVGGGGYSLGVEVAITITVGGNEKGIGLSPAKTSEPVAPEPEPDFGAGDAWTQADWEDYYGEPMNADGSFDNEPDDK
jgi:hypothetical protein